MGNVAGIWEKRNAYKSYARESEGERPLVKGFVVD
jgi:hypothetical protein